MSTEEKATEPNYFSAEFFESQKMNMFATHDSFKSLQDYFARMSGEENAIANIAMGLTFNTAMEQMRQIAEKVEKRDAMAAQIKELEEQQGDSLINVCPHCNGFLTVASKVEELQGE